MSKTVFAPKNEFETLNQVVVKPASYLIHFPSHLDKEYVRDMTIENPTKSQITFKVVCGSIDVLSFRPSCGYVKPNGSAVVQVVAGPLEALSSLKEHFFLRLVVPASNCPSNANDLWVDNVVPKKKFHSIKVNVKFGEAEEKQTDKSTSGKTQSTASETSC